MRNLLGECKLGALGWAAGSSIVEAKVEAIFLGFGLFDIGLVLKGPHCLGFLLEEIVEQIVELIELSVIFGGVRRLGFFLGHFSG